MAWLDNSRDLVMVAQENSASPRQVWILDSVTGEARRITNDANTYNRLSLAAKSRVIAALFTRISTGPRRSAAEAKAALIESLD